MEPLPHLLDCEAIARAVADEVGKTRDRVFTPMVTLALFLSQLLRGNLEI